MKKGKKIIVICCHKFTSGPDDDLVLFYKNKKYDVIHITHEFSSTKTRRSLAYYYSKGKLQEKKISKDYSFLPTVLIYLKEFIYTILFSLNCNGKIYKFYALDGLCVSFGNFLKIFNKVSYSIFWSIDFVPENRFSGKIKNFIYHLFNIIGYKFSNELWDLSPKMEPARKKKYHIMQIKKSSIVPYGVWLSRLQIYEIMHCNPYSLVYMGHIGTNSNLELVLKSIPLIKSKINQFKFHVIGGGLGLNKVMQSAKKNNVFNDCIFYGKIESITSLEKIISKSYAGIAPYDPNTDVFTQYADPGKIKTYLGCGIPVITSKVPWNANEMKENGCGFIIKMSAEQIADKVVMLFTDKKLLSNSRINSRKYASSFDYENIFKVTRD